MRDDILKQINESILMKNKMIDQCVDSIEKASRILIDAFGKKRKLLICGNGGSAADSQHIAAELISSFRSSLRRKSLPAIALTTDTSMITAFSNDFGFDRVFARQVEGIGEEGDVFMGISTSGNSVNVIEALKEAKNKGMITIGLLGKDGGKLKEMFDCSIIIPSDDTPRVQEGHILAYHIICDLVEKALFKAE